MARSNILITFFVLAVLGAGVPMLAQTGQRARPRVAGPATAAQCVLTGAYRIDVENSDKLYSAVRGATGKVPFQEQQQFFMDLSVRLTPPDLLAIECRGNRVSVGSSRSEKVTFLADGKLRRERQADGTIVNSRITMARDSLTFTSTGKAEDNLNVVFRSINGGRRLHVTRRIYAEQLAQPVVIQSFYNKLSDTVDWDVYNGRLIAGRTDIDADPLPTTRSVSDRSNGNRNEAAQDLREALDEWIDATNRRDIDAQMTFYMPQLKAFYLSRNASREAVRREKNRAFLGARSIDIRAEEPEIILQDSGRIAVMRFRKSYRIVDRAKTNSGIVVQELRWRRTPSGWRIFSERDVRVIR